MIYLDNAATTFPKPERVYSVVNEIQRTMAVNVGRGSYHIASEAMRIVDETRFLIAKLVGISNPNHVVFTPSATIAANEVIWGLDWDEFKTVYVSPFEHNSIARPLEMVRKKYGITINLLPFDAETQELDVTELERLFAVAPPDFVFLNHISNVTGAVLPINTIAKAAKIYDAVTIVDGSQSIGLIDINLQDSQIDYLIFAGHKNLYSSWGIGGFIANSNYHLQSFLAGGTGSDSLNLDMNMSEPQGFEVGSHNIIAIASLNASIKWLSATGIKHIHEKKQHLMRRLIEGLNLQNTILYLPSESVGHSSVLSFNIPGYEAGEIGTILNTDFDIAVRTGYHCAPYIHDFLGTREPYKGTVRASLGYFNTEGEVDALITAVAEL